MEMNSTRLPATNRDHELIKVQNICRIHGLLFNEKKNILRICPNSFMIPVKLSEINKDGNCFFNCLSQAITGKKNQNMIFRNKIIQHARHHSQIFGPICPSSNLEEYIHNSRMHIEGTWATDFEIIVACHLFQIDIKMFTNQNWQYFKPNCLVNSRESFTSVNLNLEHAHFEII